MKTKFIFIAAVFCLLSFIGQGFAEDKPDVKAEMKDLIGKIQTKLREGKRTEKDLADELKQFDVILTNHKGEATDEVAQVALMKAILYIQVLDAPDKAIELIKKIKTDFPATKTAEKSDEIIASIEKQIAAKKIQSSLVVGAKFPDFSEKDLAGKPLSVANYKGKVVLVDFWATWCGPCVGELPNVLKAYEKYHPKGFEIVGISLDQDKSALTKFMDERKVTWQQYFDGKGWNNKLAGVYGIQSIPATFLLDGEGKIIARDLRGEALEEVLAKQLTK